MNLKDERVDRLRKALIDLISVSEPIFTKIDSEYNESDVDINDPNPDTLFIVLNNAKNALKDLGDAGPTGPPEAA